MRDFWHDAQLEATTALAVGAPEVGSLLVTPRLYTVAGKLQVVPGHIGIITSANEGEPMRWIHANPKAGKVEEVAVSSSGVPLGAISLAGFFAARATDFLPERTPSAAAVV